MDTVQTQQIQDQKDREKTDTKSKRNLKLINKCVKSEAGCINEQTQ